MKKILLLLLTMLLPMVASARSYDAKIGGIYYNFSGSGATVTFKDATYNSYSGAVDIPSSVYYNGTTYSVTSIGTYAFYGSSGLTSVTIPESVTSVGDRAFSDCSSLTSIKVDTGNTKYDSRNDCNAIIETATNTLIAGCKNTIIPNNVTSIGMGAFFICSGLTPITIPNSVTSIGMHAFWKCSSLISVTIGNGVTTIGYEAFQVCTSLTSVAIGNSVVTIDGAAFSGC